MSNRDSSVEIFLLNLVIAGTTSSIAKTLTAPIDRTKLILQSQNSAAHILSGERKKYKGIIDCLTRLPKEQGLLSLWRGNGANVIRYIPTQALNFSFNDFFNQNFKGESHTIQAVVYTYIAGAMAGACSVFTVYPLKLCQTRLSLDMGSVAASNSKSNQKGQVEREFNGLIDCFRKIHKKEGVPGLYNGFILALLGSSMYRAMYFGMFDSLKRLYIHYAAADQGEIKKLPVTVEFLFAETVTIMAGLSTYPFDTVGRRLMMESGQPKELKLFGGTTHAIKQMYKQEGVASFYRGGMTNCIRSMCGALVLVFYDEFLYYTEWKEKLKNR